MTATTLMAADGQNALHFALPTTPEGASPGRSAPLLLPFNIVLTSYGTL